MKNCPSCQRESHDAAVFCGGCGYNFQAQQPQQEPQQPQQEQQAQYNQQQYAQQQQYQQAQYAQQQYQQSQYSQNTFKVNPYDHSDEFDPKDISEGKVFAMLCYLTGLLGVIIATIAAQKSEYTMFHVRQVLKFVVFETLVYIVSMFLFWTIIVPIVGLILAIALWIIKIVAVFQIGAGKSKEPLIIRSVGFLK